MVGGPNAIAPVFEWEIRQRITTSLAVREAGWPALVPAIAERANAEHPYDVPCMIALPILAGNPDCLAWIERETARHDQP